MAEDELEPFDVASFGETTTTTESPLQLETKNDSVHSRAYVLRQLSGPGAPRDLALTRPELVLGRSGSVDLLVESPALSRRHVRFFKEGDEYVVEDLNSRNGMFVNGVRAHSAVLRGGDALQMGNTTFLYLEGF
jgi:hypothetical protein